MKRTKITRTKSNNYSYTKEYVLRVLAHAPGRKVRQQAKRLIRGDNIQPSLFFQALLQLRDYPTMVARCPDFSTLIYMRTILEKVSREVLLKDEPFPKLKNIIIK